MNKIFHHPADHHMWTYCQHLGPWTCPTGRRYDLGVYIEDGDTISRACVYGSEPHEYISSEIIWGGKATRGVLERVAEGATDLFTLMDLELFKRLGRMDLLSEAIEQFKREARQSRIDWLSR